ncbi:MCE family protein [Kutzneria albida]|uniref:Virulence factor Mce family protein n=1 Tax=Kutzneria albida DSM 43870 TaxID=1449976 RepID=W5WGQ0_9PSEU|nr:MCE family protein [Kutzneria albida]AHH99756.1 hypothetical protein KALB_6396 [Kutzneria albida DSM 43870]
MNAGWAKAGRRLVGVSFLLVIALLMWLSVSAYQQRFTPVVSVTLMTDTTGNELHQGAEVKIRGVIVGEVRDIQTSGGGARIQLALHPDQVHLLPVNLSARLLPKSLFGERYVDLQLPTAPDSRRLGQGSVIDQDHSSSAIELEKVLSDVMPMLQAVQPQKLASTLSALDQALHGRGEQLGRTLTELNGYLTQMNPKLPELNEDVAQLVKVADTYDNVAPQVLQALTDATTTTRTFVDQQNALLSLYGKATSTATDLTGFLTNNAENLIQLSSVSVPTLQLWARYSPELPCSFKQLAELKPLMDKVLGKGTDRPGIHVDVKVTQGLGKYVPGKDTPAYTEKGGPTCYGSPRQASLPNSVQENHLINDLIGPSTGVPPQDLPGWSSLLVGPLYRGAEVTLR